MALLLPLRPKWWWPYLLLAVIICSLLWKLAPGPFLGFWDRLSPYHVGTPRISGTVVDAVTGGPVPGMDVCLLMTYVKASFGGPAYSVAVMRSETTQTDASGTFSFARWDNQLDLLDRGGVYGIAVTDPAARWKQICGRDIYLLGTDIQGMPTNVFQREMYFQQQSEPVVKSTPPPYFPVAFVNDVDFPQPAPYRTDVSFDYFPHGALVRPISNRRRLKIALVPLLKDGNECRLATNLVFAVLCREMNESLTADDLRKSWKIQPPAH
jgi:hypothetical protein